MPITIGELLDRSRWRLSAASHRPSTREASFLLGHVLDLSEAQLLARDREVIDASDVARFESLLKRRLAGEPVAYLIGEREFYGRGFQVDSRVLIPRPETEHLVEEALKLRLAPDSRILDVGTGSGCLAVTLACERPELRFVATDIEPGALAVAVANAARHGVRDRIDFLCDDLASSLRLEALDAVVSNPPYIADSEADEISIEVREHEPPRALFAPDRGIAVFNRLLEQLSSLRPATPVLVEIGRDQAESLRKLARQRGFGVVQTTRDYAGPDRIVVLRRRRD
jgi:release factor glutamine methyltransferase